MIRGLLSCLWPLLPCLGEYSAAMQWPLHHHARTNLVVFITQMIFYSSRIQYTCPNERIQLTIPELQRLWYRLGMMFQISDGLTLEGFHNLQSESFPVDQLNNTSRSMDGMSRLKCEWSFEPNKDKIQIGPYTTWLH